MNFRRNNPDDTPEINLIPLIDVLLVILIFLAATTSFTRFQAMQVALPQAQAGAPEPQALELAISQDGLYALNGQLIDTTQTAELTEILNTAASGNTQAVLVIHADAQATHESVIRIMEAARGAGIERIQFATQGRP